jgi:glycosyltransferase involved in cell wall biosynthesis
MPVAVLEAIASGTPVVVCASGGLAELPESVPKVAPDDPAGLAAAIAPLGDPAIRSKALERQRPIAEAQGWGRVGATLWRHWIPASARARRTA